MSKIQDVLDFIDRVLDDPMDSFDAEQQRNAYIIALGEVGNMLKTPSHSKESDAT